MSEPHSNSLRGLAIIRSRSARTLWVAIVVLVLVVTGLLMPLPLRGPEASPLADLAHAPIFAVLSFVAMILLSDVAPQQSLSGFVSVFSRSWFRVLCVAIALTLFGIGMECIQRYFGRRGSWGDVFLNTVGLSAGIFFFWTLQSHRDNVGKLVPSLLLVFAIGLLLFASSRPALELWLIYSNSGIPQ